MPIFALASGCSHPDHHRASLTLVPRIKARACEITTTTTPTKKTTANIGARSSGFLPLESRGATKRSRVGRKAVILRGGEDNVQFAVGFRFALRALVAESVRQICSFLRAHRSAFAATAVSPQP